MKEDQRRQRKLESAFRAMLRDNEIDYKTDWDETREKLQGEDAFRTLSIEADRVRVFKVLKEIKNCVWPLLFHLKNLF